MGTMGVCDGDHGGCDSLEIHSKMACFLSFNVCKQNFDSKINYYVVNIGVYIAITIPRYTNRCTVTYNAHCAKRRAKHFST